jgi:Uncharacterized conserved protein (COG2071)
MTPSRLDALVERRLLVNYRVDPDVAARLVPEPFRPQLVRGWAVAGVCLIRLGRLRPPGLPAAVGVRSENAAHRFAVEWDGPDGPTTGVYIPRRDTASRLTAAAGGRLFPGEHHRARFTVDESASRLRVGFTGADGTAVDVAVTVGDGPGLGDSALFADLAEASAFFEGSPQGWSARSGGDRYDGVALGTDAWRVTPVRVDSVRSTYFDDPDRFPPGSAVLDAALLMRDVPVRWQALPSVRVGASPNAFSR